VFCNIFTSYFMNWFLVIVHRSWTKIFIRGVKKIFFRRRQRYKWCVAGTIIMDRVCWGDILTRRNLKSSRFYILSSIFGFLYSPKIEDRGHIVLSSLSFCKSVSLLSSAKYFSIGYYFWMICIITTFDISHCCSLCKTFPWVQHLLTLWLWCTYWKL
jgi:hypothetical protein